MNEQNTSINKNGTIDVTATNQSNIGITWEILGKKENNSLTGLVRNNSDFLDNGNGSIDEESHNISRFYNSTKQINKSKTLVSQI